MIEEKHLTKSGPALSPFLTGTKIQYAWDSTSLGYLKTCPRLYQYIMIDGWSPKEESIHLRFGQELHSAIEDYERAKAEGLEHEDAVIVAVKELLVRTHGWEVDTDAKPGKYKNRDTLTEMVINYFDHWKDDPAQTLILADGRPAVELSFRFELGWEPNIVARQKDIDGGMGYKSQPFLLCGHLDRCVTFNSQNFVLDHKSTTTTPGQYYFNQFEPNNQMTLYTLAGQIVMDTKISGVIIDAGQILLTEPSRFTRGFTYRTEGQLAEWQRDLRYWLTLAESFAIGEYWPMNDTACDKYGGCKFREICSKDPEVREKFLPQHFNKLAPEDRWNPLKSR